jgi:hypothetical protein
VAEELGGVGDLPARLRQRLAHLQGHQEREVVDPLVQEPEGRHQHVRALPRLECGERRLRGCGCVQRPHAVVGGRVGHRAQRLARRGVDHLEGRATLGLDPGAVDAQLLGNGIDDAVLGGRVGHRSLLEGSSAWSAGR